MLPESYVALLSRTAPNLDAVAARYRCGFSLPTPPVEFDGVFFWKYSNRNQTIQAAIGWCPQRGYVQLILPRSVFGYALE